jgi:hypothetical protein
MPAKIANTDINGVSAGVAIRADQKRENFKNCSQKSFHIISFLLV